MIRVGTWYEGSGQCSFRLWAPLKKSVSVRLFDPDRIIDLQKDELGYWTAKAEEIEPGTAYLYVIDGENEYPDPASLFQRDGVNQPSTVFDHGAHSWEDGGWQGIPVPEMIIYELHIGTFTHEGTFDAAAERLSDLKDLGVNAVEIMPVAQFPGERNWGYDGVHPFSVQNSYGGPDGLKRLVDRCHQEGLAVILDVVYNHLGPEGNYLGEFAPYFTERYRTPWGQAVNFDGPYSDGVREYFIQNALYWFKYLHIDALRLDAVHGIYDFGAKHILKDLAERTARLSGNLGREFYLIAESDLNDIRIIGTPETGGYGLQAQWLDDFHHAVRAVLTGEQSGYYQDFGRIGQLAKACKEGFVYSWEYSAYRRKTFGSSSAGYPPQQFVSFIQNHDQVGNRMLGERLSALTDREGLKLAAALMILSPHIPLLFMGEEYGETAPFLYFISHIDEDLVEAVRKGRKEEFSSFKWSGEPPDPQAVKTFQQCRLNWDKRQQKPHAMVYAFYKELIRLRKCSPLFQHLTCENIQVDCDERERWLSLCYSGDESRLLAVFNFDHQAQVTWRVPDQAAGYVKVLDSADTQWGGPGASAPGELPAGEIVLLPHQCFVYTEK
ncbi:MAG: malto-oligosyltrehalose trehalohydrolase [Candidatus Omnitrophota bacterium]